MQNALKSNLNGQLPVFLFYWFQAKPLPPAGQPEPQGEPEAEFTTGAAQHERIFLSPTQEHCEHGKAEPSSPNFCRTSFRAPHSGHSYS